MKVYGMRGLVEIKNLTPHEVAVFMREDNALVLVDQAQAFLESIELSHTISALFGHEVRERKATQVVVHLPPPVDGGTEIAGWLLHWSFRKPSVSHGTFSFGISAFIPFGQRPGRAAEVVLDAFRRFLDHELREGLLIGGKRVFDPHSLDELEAPA